MGSLTFWLPTLPSTRGTNRVFTTFVAGPVADPVIFLVVMRGRLILMDSGNDSLIILQSAIANRHSSALKSVFNKPRIDSRTD
jgi:hypothetical protein